MGPKRKRAAALLVPPPMTSRRVARRVTSAFHALTRDVESGAGGAEQRQELESTRAKYQEASALSTALYSTSKWVLRLVRKRIVLERAPADGEAAPASAMQVRGAKAVARPLPRVLEVGAINTQLLDARDVSARAIDLLSSNPRIEALDFFALKPQAEFDAVVCSLVINCVPTATARVQMLELLRKHLRTDEALLFLVLPRACVERSKLMTAGRFDAVLRAVGFVELERKETPKLLHLVLSRTKPSAAARAEADAEGALAEAEPRQPAPQPDGAAPRRRIAGDFDLQFPAPNTKPKAKAQSKAKKQRTA
ncbi:putative methyltransferase-domain-containing protein [Pelagophyceae sp. CCMP2097]|nr:putative methyltransferase-domain-containing protein [Pelagophyceae sp. CCMP2097]